MPQLYQWYLPDIVMYVRFPQTTDYDFLERVNAEILEYFATSDRQTHILADARFIQQAPTNLMKIRHASPAFNSKKIGWAVLISENALYRFLGSTVPQVLTRQRTRAYPTIQEGVNFLKSREPDAPWEQANDDLFR